jgi:adenylosuccinate synthase
VGCTVILGTQWGDEGKGKIVDYLSKDIDVVARFQGGANAGHTVNVSGRETILHQLPTGILTPGVICLIGNGVVLDPGELFTEIEAVEALGLKTEDRLKISGGTHLLLPYHKVLDLALEEALGAKKLGTTCRGIGPAYTDKAARRGLRLQDLSDLELFTERVGEEVERKNAQLASLGSREVLIKEKVIERILTVRERILGMMTDVSLYLDRACSDGKRVLLEGAQGTMLDLDHGTYPFVTSSNTTIGEAVIGLGIAPALIDKALGITKAYTTRVGMGPFPTELDGEMGDILRDKGREFGATTGRPRRCGWLDTVVVRYSARINGINSIVLTKMDVLDTLEKIKVAVSYRIGNSVTEHLPSDPRALSEGEPVYEEFEGWKEDTSSARKLEQLPAPARSYIEGISELVGCKVDYVSVGPAREALIKT